MSPTITLPTPFSHALRAGILSVLVLGASTIVFGQRKLVDARDQAQGWYLPVKGQVLVNGKQAGGTDMVLYMDNKEVARTTTDKRGRFDLQLDIDHQFTLRILKNGFEAKMIYVDTHLPAALVTYPDYELYANMIPVNATNFTDNGLTAATTYSWTVRAVDAAGLEGTTSAAATGKTSAGTGGGSGTCTTSSNYAHTIAGRAYAQYGTTYAKGSNQNMGLWNIYVTKTLKKTGTDNYVIGTCP